jgi:RHS repeat-associated protein
MSDYLFTSKELDATGLYYYGARYYDPQTSVWQSTDMAIEKYIDEGGKGGYNGGIFNSKNLSLYCYSYQNPIVMFDPDGNYVLNAEQKQFLESSAIIVKEGLKGSGINSSVAIAQLMYETGWGTKKQSYFGIKTGVYSEQTGAKMSTIDVVNGELVKTKQTFIESKDLKQAVEQYKKLLTTNPVYKDVLSTTDPKEQVNAIVKGGYGEDPKYAETVKSIIDQSTAKYDTYGAPIPMPSNSLLDKGQYNDQNAK